MSALPKQVRQQIDRANEIADELARLQRGEGGDGQQPAGDTPPPGSSVPGNPPGGGDAGDATPPAGGQPPAEGWEQRYRVLQGKYNAEVPRLQRQVNEQTNSIRSMQDQLTATQNLLASLSQQQRGAPPAGDSPQPAAPVRLVKDEEVKEFGADLVDLMRRVVREESATFIPEIDRRIAPVAQRVDQAAQTAQHAAQSAARSSQQTVLDMLTERVPNWQQLNSDAEFLNWLDEVDPFSGAQRGALLQQAYQAHDGPRVVAFFSGFLKEHAAVTPPANQGQPPAGQQQQQVQQPAAQRPTQRTLDDFVAPGTPKPGAANAPDGSGKRVWSRAEIGKFYSDRSAGRYKDPKEAAKIEADIFAAQREGRIR